MFFPVDWAQWMLCIRPYVLISFYLFHYIILFYFFDWFFIYLSNSIFYVITSIISSFYIIFLLNFFILSYSIFHYFILFIFHFITSFYYFIIFIILTIFYFLNSMLCFDIFHNFFYLKKILLKQECSPSTHWIRNNSIFITKSKNWKARQH